MLRLKRAFTLIELMIIVGIIGLLMAIAMGAYQNYLQRTRVGEAMNLMSGAKASIDAYHKMQGGFPATNAMAGIPAAATINGENVLSVSVGAGGVVTATFRDNIGVLSNQTVQMSPIDAGGALAWDCTGGTTATQYRPANCR